jgi:CRISPR-associated protein Cas6/Cse3/CasE subtype I-E
MSVAPQRPDTWRRALPVLGVQTMNALCYYVSQTQDARASTVRGCRRETMSLATDPRRTCLFFPRSARVGRTQDGYQQHSEKAGRLRFSTVDFSGELTVIDPTAFALALRDGLGHSKAFGCGLMLVRRL